MATVIVDCESGNLHSAHKAFERMARETGAGEIRVSSDPDEVRRASRIVLPGDGAFPACRKALFDHRGLFEAMQEAVVAQGRPFMGICIGMQLMAARGTEHAETPGFGWIGGTVEAIRPEGGLKVPHMGWNDLRILRPHPALEGVSDGDHAYFVHSYHLRADDPAGLLAETDYGGPVTAIVGRDNLVGCQFHPEKSQATGLRIIANFLAWSP